MNRFIIGMLELFHGFRNIFLAYLDVDFDYKARIEVHVQRKTATKNLHKKIIYSFSFQILSMTTANTRNIYLPLPPLIKINPTVINLL